MEITLTWQFPSVFQPRAGLGGLGGAECSGSPSLGPCRLRAGQLPECISLLGGKIRGCFSDKLLTVRASINGKRTLAKDVWSAQYMGLTYKDVLNQPQIWHCYIFKQNTVFLIIARWQTPCSVNSAKTQNDFFTFFFSFFLAVGEL